MLEQKLGQLQAQLQHLPTLVVEEYESHLNYSRRFASQLRHDLDLLLQTPVMSCLVCGTPGSVGIVTKARRNLANITYIVRYYCCYECGWQSDQPIPDVPVFHGPYPVRRLRGMTWLGCDFCDMHPDDRDNSNSVQIFYHHKFYSCGPCSTGISEDPEYRQHIEDQARKMIRQGYLSKHAGCRLYDFVCELCGCYIQAGQQYTTMENDDVLSVCEACCQPSFTRNVR